MSLLCFNLNPFNSELYRVMSKKLSTLSKTIYVTYVISKKKEKEKKTTINGLILFNVTFS